MIETLARWFVRSSRVLVDGEWYALDWNALGAVGAFLAVLAAVAAIAHSEWSMRRQLQQQKDSEAARVREEQLSRLRQLEVGYLGRLFDAVERPYYEAFAFLSRLEVARSQGLEEDFLTSFSELNRGQHELGEMSNVTSPMLHVLSASRSARIPPATFDGAFAQYSRAVQSLIEETATMLLSVYVMRSISRLEDFAKADSQPQRVFMKAQTIKDWTADLIAETLAPSEREWASSKIEARVRAAAASVQLIAERRRV